MRLRKQIPTTFAMALAFVVAGLTGCQTSNCPELQTVPANQVRNASCNISQQKDKINFLTLRRTPPEDYVLDAGDTLGVYIQGITGDKDTPPPVHFPEDPSLQPALGYPVPIRDDGFISLPLIEPLRLSGLTLGQAEARIREAYTEDREILKEGTDKIIMTLLQRRTYNILVIREDINDSRQVNRRNNDAFLDQETQGQTFSIELPAYENDVLHALSQTGGMPGEGAFNEILVVRGGMNPQNGFGDNDGGIIEAVGSTFEAASLRDANITRIPIESENGMFPQLEESQITLNDGDVLYIEGRQQDVFYTGGLLEGGRFPLPRDYEIDVLEAIALAGGTEAQVAGGGGAGGRLGNIVPASKITIIRRGQNGGSCAISVDGECALGNASERVIIQPGDLIRLEYTDRELFINTVTSFLSFSGIFRVFR